MPDVTVYIFPRSVVSQEWWEQWYCEGIEIEPVPEGKYAFRGWSDFPNKRIVLLDDETETQASLWWLLLHELTHYAVRYAPFLQWGLYCERVLQGLGDKDERWDDELHEKAPEEVFCNRIATAFMDGREYARPWWRDRIKALEMGKTQ